MNENLDPIKEIDAMRKVAEALQGLQEEAIRRVLNWAGDHFNIKITKTAKTNIPNDNADDSEDEQNDSRNEFDEVAELYAVAQPSTDADKALVVAYWLQFKEGAASIDTQSVNTRLKHMGHGIGNVTRAFDNLKKTKPQLIVQLRKSGTSQQARKTFKVTTEGKKYIEQLIKNGSAQ